MIVIFIGQYLIIAMYPLLGGDSNLTFDFMIAVMICTMILVGSVSYTHLGAVLSFHRKQVKNGTRKEA